MKKKKKSNLVIDSFKIQSFLERANGRIKDQEFYTKFLHLKYMFKYFGIDVSFFNDSICIRFDDYLGNSILKCIVSLFPFDSYAHIVYNNGTYCISKIL